MPRPRSGCWPEASQPATCLNEQWLTNLADARLTIETWRRHYTELRPRRALRYAAAVLARRDAALSGRLRRPPAPKPVAEDATV